MKKHLPYIAVALIFTLLTFAITKQCSPKPETDYKPIMDKLQEAKIEILDSLTEIRNNYPEIQKDQDSINKEHAKIQSRPITNAVADSLARAINKNFPSIKQRQP